MYRLPCVAAVAGLVVLSPVVTAQELTEADVLARLDASPAATVLRLEAERARAQTRVRTAFPAPSLTYTRENAASTVDEFILARQDLPVTGRRGMLRSAGAALVNAAEADAEQRRRRLRADARTAFVDLLVAQARAAELEHGVQQLDELVRLLRAREQQGDTARYDRLRAEREAADARADLTGERTNIARARAALAPYIGPSLDTVLAARGSLEPPVAPSLEAAISRIEAGAYYRAALARVEAARFELRAARRERVPEPAVVAGTKRTAIPGAADTGYTIGVEARVPLFGTAAASRALATADLTRAEAEREVLRIQLHAGVRGAHEAARLTREQALQYEAAVAAIGTELARVARIAYDEGERGILELLDAYRVASAGRLRALTLRGEARAALIELEALNGEEVLP